MLCGSQGFEQALADAVAANGGKGLRNPPASEVRRILDAVSELRAPGMLVLRSERLREELAALMEELSRATPSTTAGGGSSGSPAVAGAKKNRKRAAGSKAASSREDGHEASAGVPASARGSKRRKNNPDAVTTLLHGGGAARGAATDGEPHVLNRQQVQPDRPVAHAAAAQPRCSPQSYLPCRLRQFRA